MNYERLELTNGLASQGYLILSIDSSKSVEQSMHEVAFCLGGKLLAGRGRKTFETLKILDAAQAPTRSLSRLSGANAQPWHVDGSHLTEPPHYVIFGCRSVTGEGAPPTQILKINDSALSLGASRRETFAVRNGRASFYSTIASADRPWIRFDPGCMVAQTEQGRDLLNAVELQPAQSFINVEWTADKILIVNNWSVLHRRGDSRGPGNRSIFRISLRH
nr:hypothetical protein [uncultured Albidiferax sp.]